MSGFSFYFVLTVLSAAACRNNRASPISVPVIYQNTVQLYIIKKVILKKLLKLNYHSISHSNVTKHHYEMQTTNGKQQKWWYNQQQQKSFWKCCVIKNKKPTDSEPTCEKKKDYVQITSNCPKQQNLCNNGLAWSLQSKLFLYLD